jgi:hypothetical protein
MKRTVTDVSAKGIGLPWSICSRLPPNDSIQGFGRGIPTRLSEYLKRRRHKLRGKEKMVQ